MLSRLRFIAPFAAAIALAGCGGGGSSGAPRDNVWHGGDVPPVSASFVYRILPGAGIDGVVPGQSVGFYITANTGGSFRVVWTGDTLASGVPRHFQGSLYTQGNFTSVAAGCSGNFCALEPDDLISTVKSVNGGQRIDFDTFASDGLDGLDFVVDTVPAIFQLNVDGASDPSLVFFPATDNGGQVSNAGGQPFGLVPE
jgi:hypothetical protein